MLKCPKRVTTCRAWMLLENVSDVDHLVDYQCSCCCDVKKLGQGTKNVKIKSWELADTLLKNTFQRAYFYGVL